MTECAAGTTGREEELRRLAAVVANGEAECRLSAEECYRLVRLLVAEADAPPGKRLQAWLTWNGWTEHELAVALNEEDKWNVVLPVLRGDHRPSDDLAQQIEKVTQGFVAAEEWTIRMPWSKSGFLGWYYMESGPRRSTARREWIAQHGWIPPTADVLNVVAALHSQILEIGAGVGLWARALSRRGVQVEAWDVVDRGASGVQIGLQDEIDAAIVRAGGLWHSRIKEGLKPLALMLVWPPFDSQMASRAVETFAEAGGDRLIYVGERCADDWSRPCTGDRRFHELLNAEWAVFLDMALPNETGLASLQILDHRKNANYREVAHRPVALPHYPEKSPIPTEGGGS